MKNNRVPSLNNTERFAPFSTYLFLFHLTTFATNTYTASGGWMITENEVQKVQVTLVIC
jgi:hypothetical protein